MMKISTENIFANHADRQEVEAFIAEVFYQSCGAKITHFMPQLIALRDDKHTLVAAFGLRHAAYEKLFLEQYLDQPIEVLMQEKLGIHISRNDIYCIGNLAVANMLYANILIAKVVEHSLAQGIPWCVATAPQSLQNGVMKAGCNVYTLHVADQFKLPIDEQTEWGTYYSKTPEIVAIRGTSTQAVMYTSGLAKIKHAF